MPKVRWPKLMLPRWLSLQIWKHTEVLTKQQGLDNGDRVCNLVAICAETICKSWQDMSCLVHVKKINQKPKKRKKHLQHTLQRILEEMNGAKIRQCWCCETPPEACQTLWLIGFWFHRLYIAEMASIFSSIHYLRFWDHLTNCLQCYMSLRYLLVVVISHCCLHRNFSPQNANLMNKHQSKIEVKFAKFCWF